MNEIRKNLDILPWLTISEALVALKDMTSIEMDESDLHSQCEHGNCDAYAFIDGKVGWSESLIFPFGEDPVPDCYAVGPQKIMNPAGLRNPSLSSLRLLGTVCLDPGFPDEKFENVEWYPRTPLSGFDLRYPTASIKELAGKMPTATKKSMDPREIRSVAKIIAVMAAAAKIDLAMPYKAVGVLNQLAAQHGIPFELNQETVAKYLKLAKEEV